MVSELWSDIRYRVRALLRRRAMESDLDEELRFHLEREADKHEAAGLSRDEAIRRARVAFGGVERAKDESRDGRGTQLLESAMQDLRYSIRTLRARPGFTLGVVMTLGLGIGANAAMFGIVDRLLFRPPPFLRDAGRVHRLYFAWTDHGTSRLERNTSFARFSDLEAGTSAFDAMAAFQVRRVAIGGGDRSREVDVDVTSAALFRLFDAPPVLGRYFTADEDRAPEGAQVAVLSYPFWQTEYGGRADVLGERLQIGNMTATVIGVTPEGFAGIDPRVMPALHVPLTAYAFSQRGAAYTSMYHWGWIELVARRKADVPVDRAIADLTAAFERTWAADSDNVGQRAPAIARPHARLGPVQLERGPQASRETQVVNWVSGVSLIVLLMACANVTNLLLSNAVRRRREVALRLALGVSRGRLIRQLLTDTFVLAVLGGAAGIAVAQWGGVVLRQLFLRDDPGAVIADARTLAWTALATAAAALVTGLVPAWQGARTDVAPVLGSAREGHTPPSKLRGFLLVFQATLSVVLLVGAGLFVRSLQHVHAMRLGYDVDRVLFVESRPRGVKLTREEQLALDRRVLEVALSIPGVTHGSLAPSIPFWSNEGRLLRVSGIDDTERLGRFVLQAGSADYFATVGTRLVRGRGIQASDRAGTPRVAVVSEGMARALWPGREAIGQCFRIGPGDVPCTEVIGIAEDMRIRTLTDDREFTYYVPIDQYGEPTLSLFLRLAGDPADAADSIRLRLQPLMPGGWYVAAQPLRGLIDPRFKSWEFGATMFLAFGGLALALAAIGLYSLIAYNVAQRRQEIGIRMALGATRAGIARLVVGGGIQLVIAGIMSGGVIALWAGRAVEPLLFRQSATDPLVFGSVAVLLLGVALLATVLPAISAARVEPQLALRAE
jgi:putative ABC transport system permease protein